MRNDILIISLKYLEPYYKQTLQSILASGLPVIFADRDGVGNMARAFNKAPSAIHYSSYKYFWFITDIAFDPAVPDKLALALDEGYHAVHPAMAGSDHQHQWPDGSDTIKTVKFIEFTAPMIRSSIFQAHQLEEGCPYYHFDLDFSHRLKINGLKLGVHHGARIQHTYLRNNKSIHPISRIRSVLRDYWTPFSKQRMCEKYGPNWREVMQWKE